MSYCNVWAEVVFLWFSEKGDVDTNFTMPIFCASPNSIMSLSFRYWSIPVSEIRWDITLAHAVMLPKYAPPKKSP